MASPFIITIVGPESSGKTTLAGELARLIGCSWLPEHAREFLAQLDHPYTFHDLVTLAGIQHNLIQREVKEKKTLTDIEKQSLLESITMHADAIPIEEFAEIFRPFASAVLILDSGMLTIQQWASIKYGRTIDVVEESLRQDVTSIYILTRAQKAWEPDPLREAPVLLDRAWIFNQYLGELQRQGKYYVTGMVDVTHVRTD